MHWGISYLREDIQDLRLDQRAGLDRMERLGARIEAVNDNLSSRMDSMHESLTTRMDSMSKDLTARIDAGNARTDSRFAVLLTAMIGLIGIGIGANFTFLQMYLPSQ